MLLVNRGTPLDHGATLVSDLVATLLGAVVAALLSFALSPWVTRVLERRSVIDHPVARSSHSIPTPRGGGIAPAVGALAGAGVAVAATDALLLVIAGAALAFGLLGLRDDLAPLSARYRLLVQAVIAAAVSVPLVRGFESDPRIAVLAVTAAVWIVAYVNAFNFMDGINGISAAQVTVAGVSWALVGSWQGISLVTVSGTVVAAAALAFAPFNFPTAKVFLGDTGSYFFGGWLAAMAVGGLGRGLTIEMALAPLAISLADTGTTLLRRAARRESLTTPHRDHVYQQLVVRGWSHSRTTVVVASLSAVCAAFGALSLTGIGGIRVIGATGITMTIGGYLFAPSCVQVRPPATARRTERRKVD